MDHSTFEHKVAVYRPDFYGLALRILGNPEDADDVAQDTLLRLWDIRDRLEDYSSIKSLGLIVTRHKCIDRLRSVSPNTSLDEAMNIDSGTPSPDRSVEARESLSEVSRLLHLLPAGQREVMKLRHIDGLETSEIAEITGSREATVRVALSRARNRLKEMFLSSYK